MQKITLILIVFSILGFCYFAELYFYSVIYYAHLSTTASCRPTFFEEQYSSNYTSAAQTSYNNVTKNITIKYFYTPSTGVIKHEECHKKQFEQHRLFNCRLLILNEIECYTIQRWYEFIEK